MINVNSELHFLVLNIKAFLSFKIKSFFAWIINGHYFFYRAKKKYLETHALKKLHIGSNIDIEGYLNSQVTKKFPINITKKLPFDDNTFDVIFSTHVLEHIHRKEIDSFISECYRVLKPSGKNIICTPSLKKISQISYSDKDKLKKILFKRQNKWHDDNIQTACHQLNLTMRNFGHRFIVDDEYMSWLSHNNKYSQFEVSLIDNVPDKKLIEYIKNDKTDIWEAESDIYVLTK